MFTPTRCFCIDCRSSIVLPFFPFPDPLTYQLTSKLAILQASLVIQIFSNVKNNDLRVPCEFHRQDFGCIIRIFSLTKLGYYKLRDIIYMFWTNFENSKNNSVEWSSKIIDVLVFKKNSFIKQKYLWSKKVKKKENIKIKSYKYSFAWYRNGRKRKRCYKFFNL